MKRINFRRVACAFIAVCVAGLFPTSPLSALSPDPATAKITFTFDDARASSYSTAAPTLKTYGLKGMLYVTTGCVGMTKTPNTCHAANDVSYMTWDQVTALQNTYGWEVGSHSMTHPYMASTNADDDQPNLLTLTQVEQEVSGSKTALSAHGINAQSFASPYGDYSMDTLRIIAKYYESHRAFKEESTNVYPYNDRLINNFQVQYPVTLSAVQKKVDEAITKKSWLVLTFHDIKDKASTNANQYQWSTANFKSLAAYVKQKVTAGQLANVNVSEGIVNGTQNLLPAVIASNKIGNGWATDQAGSFVPSSTYTAQTTADTITSLRALGGQASAHLFSPAVTVNNNQVYVIKSYLSVSSITAGEIGYYIDEYDASGTWISGQYKTREYTPYVENLNVTYQPSSVIVKSARLQVYITAGSTIQATVDAFKWFTVAGSALTPTSLLPNGEFDQGLGTWTTDNASSVKADTANHGSGTSTATAVAFSKSNGTAHLFSPLISVTAGRNYYFENYLNITANTGSSSVVGVYIDEYDTNGTWISGQYKATSSSLGARTVQIAYTPTSTSVAKIREQFIFAAPSSGTISGYIDSVSCILL